MLTSLRPYISLTTPECIPKLTIKNYHVFSSKLYMHSICMYLRVTRTDNRIQMLRELLYACDVLYATECLVLWQHAFSIHFSQTMIFLPEVLCSTK